MPYSLSALARTDCHNGQQNHATDLSAPNARCLSRRLHHLPGFLRHLLQSLASNPSDSKGWARVWGWQQGYALSKASDQGDGAKKAALQTLCPHSSAVRGQVGLALRDQPRFRPRSRGTEEPGFSENRQSSEGKQPAGRLLPCSWPVREQITLNMHGLAPKRTTFLAPARFINAQFAHEHEEQLPSTKCPNYLVLTA